MDSPKRKQLKRNDYLRHKVFRKIRKQQKAELEQLKKAAEKELKRRLRVTPLPKFDKGLTPKDEYEVMAPEQWVVAKQRERAKILYDSLTGKYSLAGTGEVVTPLNRLVEDDPSTWTFVDENGRRFDPHNSVFNNNPGEIRLAEEAPFLSNNYIKQAAHNYTSELEYDINNNRVVGGKYTMPAIALAPFVGSKIGGAAINSAFAAHGLNHAINEGVDGIGDAAITTLEMLPLYQMSSKLVPNLFGNAQRYVKQFPYRLRIPIDPERYYRIDGSKPFTREQIKDLTSLLEKNNYGVGRGVEIDVPTKNGMQIRDLSPKNIGYDYNGNLRIIDPDVDVVSPDKVVHSDIITAENAASMTPEQWTAAQDAAIARGDMAEAQRLRDLHFKVSAPNTQIKDIQYHGSKGNAKFNVFDPNLIGQTDKGWAGRGYYFTPSEDYAKMYGLEPRAFYINAQKVHDGTAATYFGRENGPAANAFKIIRKRHNNDGQQILDELASSDAIRTSFPQTQPYNGTFEEVVTRNNNQMKLADAVTFDDNGVRIPLGERDNFNINDIRYGLLPFGIGLGGLGLVNKNNRFK